VSPPFGSSIIIAGVNVPKKKEKPTYKRYVSTFVPFVFPVSIFAVRAPN
jgi:hypothetical protein